MSKTLFFNAKVYVEKGCFAQAVYQEDGWIKAVGTNEEVKAFAAPDAEVVDCEGKTLIPGFNDSHMHILQFGEVLNEPYIKGCRSVEEMVEICKKFAAEHPDMVKNGMHGQGWNQDLFDKDKVRLPNRYDLDEISTVYPIMLERVCAHTCVLNSKALELLGIDRNTPVDVFPGGTVEKDENGEPTGYMTENALYEVRHVVPDPDAEGIQKKVLSAMKYASLHGLTSVQSNDLGQRTAITDEHFQLYKDLYEQGIAPLRFRHQVCCLLEEDLDAFLEGEFANRASYKKYNGWLTLGPLKMFKDGSLGACTALMRKPYLNDPRQKNLGIDSLEPDLQNCLVQKAASHGLQSVTHVIGDAAVEETVKAYEKVLADGKNVLRNTLIHAQITDTPLLEYIRKTDSIIAYQPAFINSDWSVVAPRVGDAMTSTSYAMKQALDLGIHTSYGTDCPVEDCNPFKNIYCAVNRKDLKGNPAGGWLSHQCVSVEDAIDCYTVESAYQEFAESFKGRIKPGYYADLEILDTDIFTCEPMAIKDIMPELVMVGGKIVVRDKVLLL